MTTKLLRRPVAQDQVIVLVSAEESNGELFRCEYIAREVSLAPGDHIHTQQEERLEVLEGTVRSRVAGAEHILTPRANDGHSARHIPCRVERGQAWLPLDFGIPACDECASNVPRVHRQSVTPRARGDGPRFLVTGSTVHARSIKSPLRQRPKILTDQTATMPPALGVIDGSRESP